MFGPKKHNERDFKFNLKGEIYLALIIGNIMEIDWNLDQRDLVEIPIYHILYNQSQYADTPEAISSRLLIFSHYLSKLGIPSFHQKSLYFENDSNAKNNPQENIIIFDIYETFLDFKDLPPWAIVSHWTWIPKDYFLDLIIDLFSRSLTLFLYYKFIVLKPLYFTSFIIIPQGQQFLEPFILQYVPVLLNGSIHIRTVIQNGLECIISPQSCPSKDSFILFPPYEHPLLVIDELTPKEDGFIAQTVDKQMRQVSLRDDDFILLTNPSLVMSLFFENSPQPRFPLRQQDHSQFESANPTCLSPSYAPTSEFSQEFIQDPNDGLCSFFRINLFDFKEDEWNTFTQNKADEPFAPNEEIDFVDTIIDAVATPEQIMTEFSFESTIKQEILRCIGKNGIIESVPQDLKCIVANFLSYYRFDFGFSVVNLPSFIHRFGHTSRIKYYHLGIPEIVVNRNGQKYDVKADQALATWEKEVFLPISGPKNAYFVVFSIDTVSSESVMEFMFDFTTIYSMCGFGNLDPYPRKDHFVTTSREKLPSDIMKYFDNLTEFQEYPVITFIVSPPIFDPSFKPHSVVNYIKPNVIDTATFEEMKTLAFVVYSRMRPVQPQPIGKIDPIPQQQMKAVMFCYRYSPPFFLKRFEHDSTKLANSYGQKQQDILDIISSIPTATTDVMEMHVAWDPLTKLSVWIDDIGSILHVLPTDNITEICDFIQNAHNLLGPQLKFTVTTLGEGIVEELYHDYEECLHQNVEIYSVAPAPALRAHFDEEFADDVVVFGDPEQIFQTPKCQLQKSAINYDRNQQFSKYVTPSKTCYVMSKCQPPYMVSAYRNATDKQILGYVKKMSHLSWLSIKPGDEKRTISYPPHICALLRKNNCSCKTISLYEFLPSQEKI